MASTWPKKRVSSKWHYFPFVPNGGQKAGVLALAVGVYVLCPYSLEDQMK